MPAFSPPFTAAHRPMADFAAPARPRAELWRTILGLLICPVLTTLLVVLILTPVVVAYGPDECRRVTDAAMSAGTPAGVIGLLYSFLPLLLGLVLTVLILMRRGPLTLIGPFRPFIRNFLRIGLPLMALWLALLPLTISGDDVMPHLALADWTPWLPAALIGLLVQTTTEEVFFRGYLQQQLAARFSSRWVWMVLPALLFGLAHYGGDHHPMAAVLTMIWAAAFGLAAADLTARSGNLGASLALHVTNNISAVLLVGFAGPLDGLNLYTVQPTGDLVWLYFGQDALSLSVAWLIARLMLRR